MASVSVPVRTLEEGELLPKVCAITGKKADRQLRVVISRTPFWVWFLLPLPLLFIPAWAFATERVVGRIPVISRVHRGATALAAVRVALLVAAAVVAAAGVIGAIAGWPGLLGSIGLLAAWAALGGQRSRYSVRGRIDPDGTSVTFEGVAPTFADAVEQLQPFLR
ncbi:MAG: hypothetical protein AAGA99_09485 [Actinomycetota bacterium]